MTRSIFVNLPVADLPRSRAFYEALGFTNNPQFSDDTAACMVWSESISVMARARSARLAADQVCAWRVMPGARLHHGVILAGLN
jgi:hypothetical protein